MQGNRSNRQREKERENIDREKDCEKIGKKREKESLISFGGDEKVPRKCSPCVSPRVPPAMDKHLVYSKIALT